MFKLYFDVHNSWTRNKSIILCVKICAKEVKFHAVVKKLIF